MLNKNRRHLLASAIVIGLLLDATAAADSWAWPEPFERTSPNERWQASVAHSDDGPIARILDRRTGQETTLRLKRSEVFPVDAAMLDGGQLLVFDQWHCMGYGDSVVVGYARQADSDVWSEQWRRSLEELLGDRAARAVPTSVSSRWWRKSPLEWQPLQDHLGPWISVTLHDENKLDIHVEVGAARYRPVEDVGDDPDRLIRRADDLSDRRHYQEAAKLLERVWAGPGAPIDEEFVLPLANALLRAEEPERAIELLETHVSRSPPAPTSNDPRIRRHRALWQTLANSYVAAGRPGDAERAWRALIVDVRDPWRYVRQLTNVLFEMGDEKQALIELSTYYRGMQSAGHGDWTLERAAGNVGSMMMRRGHPKKAVLYLADSWNPGHIQHFFGIDYAKALEATGQPDKALTIWKALLAEFGDDSAYRRYRQQASEAIERLQAH